MPDKDLAQLYKVMTRNLNKAVNRNLKRFPEDFMFRLTKKEFSNLMFHFGTSSWGGKRKMPYAFTEQGVAMLSCILNSERAILVNIYIIRVFTRLRKMLLTNKDVLLKLEKLERKVSKQDGDIRSILEYLKELLMPTAEPIRRIGFRQKEAQASRYKS